MRRWVWILLIVASFIIFGTLYLYQYAGLKYFVRTVSIIENSQTKEEKKQSWDVFNNESIGLYSGIYAGMLMNRVGIWGKTGLRLFTTDQYSVYRYIDGCSGTIANDIASGKGEPNKHIFFGLDENWKNRVKVGDYAIIIITGQGNGGTPGNLREIFVYNYWPFIQKDIHTECAK